MTPSESESLRHAVLEILAPRYPASLNPKQILRKLEKEVEFPINQADMESALKFLEEKKFTRVDLDSLGSTQYWSATHEGVLYFERQLK